MYIACSSGHCFQYALLIILSPMPKEADLLFLNNIATINQLYMNGDLYFKPVLLQNVAKTECIFLFGGN